MSQNMGQTSGNMAASGQNSLRVQLTHDSNKHEVMLVLPPGHTELTLAHLSKEAARITDVPVGKQKLICKGKSLTDQFASLKSLGIKNNSKIMLIGKRANPEKDANTKVMDQVQVDSTNIERRLGEIVTEADGIGKGFLPSDLVAEAVKKLTVRVRACAEDFTRLLEKLDSLTLAEAPPEVRQRRKSLVNSLQSHLDRCDSIRNDLKDRENNARL